MSKSSFHPIDFLRRVGRRLVLEFDDAGQSSTPGLIGAAREHPARKQLERLLPHVASIGTGIITDSFGGLSRQQDVVVYERDNCPIFSVNDTPESTYFPCEGTIAVGEIKSTIGSDELRDAFQKIASVKSLKRYSVAEKDPLNADTTAFRHYGSVLSAVGTAAESFDQANKPLDQVFGFVLCGKFNLKPETMLEKIAVLTSEFTPALSPGIIVSLGDGFFQFHSEQLKGFALSPQNADCVAFSDEPDKGFVFLLQLLSHFVRSGRSVQLKAFNRYFLPPGSASYGARIVLKRDL